MKGKAEFSESVAIRSRLNHLPDTWLSEWILKKCKLCKCLLAGQMKNKGSKLHFCVHLAPDDVLL